MWRFAENNSRISEGRFILKSNTVSRLGRNVASSIVWRFVGPLSLLQFVYRLHQKGTKYSIFILRFLISSFFERFIFPQEIWRLIPTWPIFICNNPKLRRNCWESVEFAMPWFRGTQWSIRFGCKGNRIFHMIGHHGGTYMI